jgi:hypothetical protein
MESVGKRLSVKRAIINEKIAHNCPAEAGKLVIFGHDRSQAQSPPEVKWDPIAPRGQRGSEVK